MNGRAIVSSVFLGLTLPTIAFASVPTSNTLSSLDQEQFNPFGTVEIAQRYLSADYVSSRLYSSESQILGIAREYSKGQKVRWDSVSVEQINAQEMKLNIHGKILKLGKPPIRVGLKLQRNNQGDFVFVGYDWKTGGKCRKPCRRRVRKALRNLPSHFTRFQQVLNRIIA